MAPAGASGRHRAEAVGGGAVAELAVWVVAPGERRPPPAWRARLWKAPAPMAVRLLSAAGDTGLDRLVGWCRRRAGPASFSPHAMPVLSDFLMAQAVPPRRRSPSRRRRTMTGVGTSRSWSFRRPAGRSC